MLSSRHSFQKEGNALVLSGTGDRRNQFLFPLGNVWKEFPSSRVQGLLS